ncbi:MAG: hypothetical protein HYU86_12510 [Chloroflexi bacterium]|nr:hypothetical protein [Chloroflexota bacterium]
MREERNYWIDVLQKRLSRRQALRAAAKAGLGMTGITLLGCAAAPAPTPTPAKAPSAAATPTPRPQPSPTPAVTAPASAVLSYAADPTSLDTHLDSTRSGVGIHDLIYDGLFRRGRNPKLDLIPCLALSYRTVDDLTWEFKLRSGVKFHNGEEFNAEVVKFNVERQQDAAFKPRYITDFKDITEVKVMDPLTVRIISKTPDPTMPLKFIQSMVVPMKYVKEKGNAILTTDPVGTGPYRFLKWVKDERIELEANEGWWGWQKGAPWEKSAVIKKLTFRPIPQDAGRIASLRTGEVDIFHPISVEGAKAIKDDPNLEARYVRSASSPWIGISQLEPGPLRNKQVRQALNYAVDVDTMLKTIMAGTAERQYSAVGPSYMGYDPNRKPYPYDPKKAKELLAAAGYPNGFEVVFDNPERGHPYQKENVQAIAQYLAEVGVKAKIVPHATAEDFSGKAKQAGTGPVGLIYGTRGTSTLDPDFVLYQSFHSQGSENYSYYNNPEFDRLVEEGRRTMDQEKRVPIYRKALELAFDDPAAIYLWQWTYEFGINKKKLPSAQPRLWLMGLYDYGPTGP